jgi:hypothetical protein
MNIPQVRARLLELAAEQAALAERLAEIANTIVTLETQLYRRNYDRAPVRSPRITADIKRSVRAMASANPDMHYQDIAEAHNINMGRVSEILHGKR